MIGQPTLYDLHVFENIGVLLQKLVVEKKFISYETMHEIVSPIRDEEWEIKTAYFKNLQQILKTAKSEEEILEKSKELQHSMRL